MVGTRRKHGATGSSRRNEGAENRSGRSSAVKGRGVLPSIGADSDSEHGDSDDRVSVSYSSSANTSVSSAGIDATPRDQRASRVTSTPRSEKKERVRGHVPLPDMVQRRAFECVAGARGIASKVVDISSESVTSKKIANSGQKVAGALPRGRPVSSTFRLEELPHGEELDFGRQVSGGLQLWGVDLHSSDLEYLAGFPGENHSPWNRNIDESDSEDEDEENSWQCVYLNASLNRLRGMGAVIDQPGLSEVCYLDVSYNLIEDLDNVQKLPDLQAFIATNNQIESAEPLGEMPKDSRLCYVDLSSNSLSTVGTPRFPRAFQHIKTLRLAGNRIEYVEDDAAISLKSLERLDISDNEFVSIDWVVLLLSLRFLDCSANRLSALSTFAKALAGPPDLEEVIAEGNEVVSEPKYRISVLMKCERLRRLDHRLVDREDFQRQAHRALETDALADVREIAHKEFYRSVEQARLRLERQKSILKTQEQRLNQTFQAYQLQKQREMTECIAFAESLREEGSGEKGGGVLTLDVAHQFQEAMEETRTALAEGTKGGNEGGAPVDSNDQTLSTVLQAVVREAGSKSSAAGIEDGTRSVRSSGAKRSSRDVSDEDTRSISRSDRGDRSDGSGSATGGSAVRSRLQKNTTRNGDGDEGRHGDSYTSAPLTEEKVKADRGKTRGTSVGKKLGAIPDKETQNESHPPPRKGEGKQRDEETKDLDGSSKGGRKGFFGTLFGRSQAGKGKGKDTTNSADKDTGSTPTEGRSSTYGEA